MLRNEVLERTSEEFRNGGKEERMMIMRVVKGSLWRRPDFHLMASVVVHCSTRRSSFFTAGGGIISPGG
jgi:hypothetical protein